MSASNVKNKFWNSTQNYLCVGRIIYRRAMTVIYVHSPARGESGDVCVMSVC